MPNNPVPTAEIKATIAGLAQPGTIETLGPIAARFVYSLRLIALHQRVRRDPVPELASRLNSINVAAKSLALSQTVSSVWPENIHVSRFCCTRLSHDEATIAAAIDAAADRHYASFVAAIEGLIRPERAERLWDDVLQLVEAELTAV